MRVHSCLIHPWAMPEAEAAPHEVPQLHAEASRASTPSSSSKSSSSRSLPPCCCIQILTQAPNRPSVACKHRHGSQDHQDRRASPLRPRALLRLGHRRRCCFLKSGVQYSHVHTSTGNHTASKNCRRHAAAIARRFRKTPHRQHFVKRSTTHPLPAVSQLVANGFHLSFALHSALAYGCQ